ncbi:MAG TPA: hypothetical protein VN132_12540 [Bdellovibrio sp.]|nr:hypothetical protein [Bdellovibrio sp.]
MKLFNASIVMFFALVGSAAMAQNVRPCTGQVLSCSLVELAHGTTLDQENKPFSGLNDDEPSIQPDQCSIVTQLRDQKGLTYIITLEDKTYTANVYVRNLQDETKIVSSGASLYVVPGKKFFFSYGIDQVSCVLQ